MKRKNIRSTPSSSDLWQHALPKAVLRDNETLLFLSPLIIEHRREAGRVELWAKERSPKAKPEPYNYYSLVLYRLFRIADALRGMSYSESLLSKPPGERTLLKHGMSQADWFNYHHAAFVVQTLTVPDAALVLVNDVRYLGFPERLCTRQNILGNRHVGPTSTGKAIEQLYKVVNPFRDKRHSYVHRGETPDHGSESLDMYEFYEAGLRLEGAETLFGDMLELLKRARREGNREFARTMKRTRTGLIRQVLTLYDALLPAYEATKAALPKSDDRFGSLVAALGLDEGAARRAVVQGERLRRTLPQTSGGGA